MLSVSLLHISVPSGKYDNVAGNFRKAFANKCPLGVYIQSLLVSTTPTEKHVKTYVVNI